MIRANSFRSARHGTYYLENGPRDGTPLIFLHGWPELSHSWRHQLEIFGNLGFCAIAPDMRGYGWSDVYSTHEAYRMEEVVGDMIELLDHLGAERAIWVGHDFGAPVVWGLAQHRPERCHAVVTLCVPYIPGGFVVENLIPLVNRDLYPAETHPAGQWDYQLFYRDHFAEATATFDADAGRTVRALFRAGEDKHIRRPALSSSVSCRGGWYGGGPVPDMARDERVLTADDEMVYTRALIRTGFFGADSWYLNDDANIAYAIAARDRWRIELPVLFLHATYDTICDTDRSALVEQMREWCPSLTEETIRCGHWMAQEKPHEVGAALARWLVRIFPRLGCPVEA